MKNQIIGLIAAGVMLVGLFSVAYGVGVFTNGPTTISTSVAGMNTLTTTEIQSIPGVDTTITQQDTLLIQPAILNTTTTITSTVIGAGTTTTTTITTTITNSTTITISCPQAPFC